MPHISIKSLAHITGGGLIENLPRVIPKDLSVIINTDTWNLPPIFAWLSEQGKINSDEMFKAFNCGIGLVLCVEHNNVDKTINYLNDNGETAWVIGSIIKNNGGSKIQIK